ncbi:MAG: hypothetical protein U1F15_06160 [Burkholderiales bacterium]
MSRCTQEEARSAKPRAHSAFSRLADVVGVGIARRGDGYALKVNLRCAPPAGVALPSDIDGVPVEVEVVGTLGKRGPA